jgi:sugar lactone lactonase YvrE
MPTPNLEMTTKPELTLPKWQRVTSQADGLGESPFWHPLEKRLYWLDIPGQRLRRMAMSADLESEQQIEDWALGEEPGDGHAQRCLSRPHLGWPKTFVGSRTL